MTKTDSNPDKKKSPYTIWLLVLSFAAPVVLAYLMFFFGNINAFSNHGEILSPIINIETFHLKDKENTPIPIEKLTYKWRLVSFLGHSCNEACTVQLHDIKQIHASLGKDRHRVLQMLVHLQPPDTALQALLKSNYSDAIEVYGEKNIISQAIGNNPDLENNATYIMDPMGNVMMRFTADQPNKDFLTDLKKLLKASQIG